VTFFSGLESVAVCTTFSRDVQVPQKLVKCFEVGVTHPASRATPGQPATRMDEVISRTPFMVTVAPFNYEVIMRMSLEVEIPLQWNFLILWH